MNIAIENNYKYRHPLAGTLTIDQVEVSISKKGRRMLGASEVERLGRLAALSYFKKNYHSAQRGDLEVSQEELAALMAIMDVDQSELARLLTCHKSKINRALKDTSDMNFQKLGQPHIALLLERLGTELIRKGYAKNLANRKPTNSASDTKMAEAVEEVKYCAA